MKKLIWMMCCVCLYSSQALAVCSTTITASTPTEDFFDHGNGTITHTKTGLMWKRCAEGLVSGASCTGTAVKYTWQGALNRAKAVNNTVGFAGFHDWRVPNQKELGSIMERKCKQPAINSALFPGTVRDWHWSSSHAATANNALYISFGLGNEGDTIKGLFTYVRLVRGGQ